jgi:hypothetical protein
MCDYIEIKLFVTSIYIFHYFQPSWRKLMLGCNCYPNINLRGGGLVKVEANFFDLNAELKIIFK